MREEVEILWRGIVHYRRSKENSTVNEAEELIKKGIRCIQYEGWKI